MAATIAPPNTWCPQFSLTSDASTRRAAAVVFHSQVGHGHDVCQYPNSRVRCRLQRRLNVSREQQNSSWASIVAFKASSPASVFSTDSPRTSVVVRAVGMKDSLEAVDSLEGSDAEPESFGEVDSILGSRVVERRTQYLIQWTDDHPDSWEPYDNVAKDLVAAFEEPWWAAARKADEKALKSLLEQGRDIDAIDSNGRTALLFAAGVGQEKTVRFLAASGASLDWQDKDGYTALHIAAGYVHSTVVKALLELGANPEVEDSKERTALTLTQQLLESTPKNNPMQFARRLALDQVVKLLDEAVFEEVEVEQILDRREVDGLPEYLVRWSDGGEDSWEPAENIGEDLVQDYEEGLEYGVAEAVLEKRETKEGGVEYLVKWSDGEDNTWEPEENVAAEVVAEFEGVSVEEVEAGRVKVVTE